MDYLTKPGSPEELVLEHHGVAGMKWGHRKARASGPSNRQMNKASRKSDKAADNKAIDAARGRLNSSAGKLNKAEKQFKTDKKTIGSREARKKRAVARNKFNSDLEIASMTKHGAEKVGTVLGLIGGVVAAGVVAAAIPNRRL